MVSSIPWADAPSTATPLTAANLNAMQAWIVTQVNAAAASASAAAASATAAAAPADDVVAGLIASPTTSTTTQLAGRYSGPRPGLVAWRKARATIATAPVRILCIGDSITEGYNASDVTTRWSGVLASRLASRYSVPTSPTGHVTTYFGGTTPNPFTKTNVTVAGNFGVQASQTGLLGATTGQLAATLTGTSIDVHYATGGASVAFTVKIDGVQVGGTYGGPTGSIIDGNKAHIAMGASGSHTVQILAGAGQIYITGVTLFDGNESAGVQVYNAGSSGATAARFSAPAANATVATWQMAYQAIAPHLVIVMLSANDYAGSTPLATFQTNLDTIVANIRSCVVSAQPQPSILFVNPAKLNNATTAQWETYTHAMRTAAKKDGSAEFYDLGVLMPDIGSTAGNASGYYYDGTHPTTSGHARIAQILDLVLADAIPA